MIAEFVSSWPLFAGTYLYGAALYSDFNRLLAAMQTGMRDFGASLAQAAISATDRMRPSASVMIAP